MKNFGIATINFILKDWTKEKEITSWKTSGNKMETKPVRAAQILEKNILHDFLKLIRQNFKFSAFTRSFWNRNMRQNSKFVTQYESSNMAKLNYYLHTVSRNTKQSWQIYSPGFRFPLFRSAVCCPCMHNMTAICVVQMRFTHEFDLNCMLIILSLVMKQALYFVMSNIMKQA